MATGVQNAWSTTAASNGNADTAVVAAEGQAPSTVNDAMRAIMALAKKLVKDWQGALVTAGTSTAYTLTTNEVLTLADGVRVACRMHTANGAAATLNVDGTGAVAIQSKVGTAAAAGALLSGAIYGFVYYAASAAWLVEGIVAGTDTSLFLPTGTKAIFQQTAAPTGWTKDTTSYNDYALRLVTGTVSSAGSVNFSTVFGRTATDSHTLTESQMPAHVHSNAGKFAGTANTVNLVSGGSVPTPTGPTTWNTDTTGGGAGHTHNIDLRVKYVDFILATRD